MQKSVKIIPSIPKLPTKKRVCAYARVSSDKDAMHHSLSAQVSYYSDLIQKNSGWEYVGVYADEGITGTKDTRAEFKRLIEDCHAGKIDIVLTKSISRFARNTVILLETVRELKELGIDVYFEREHIHSMSGDGELMLTILASFAQEESLSVSENCKWRIRKRFQNGELVNLRMLYGYNISKKGIVINPKQAEIVRMVFTDYLDGMGTNQIAEKLNNMGVKTYFKCKWTHGRVSNMLHNEKYTGNALLQKDYSVDHLTKKVARNRGELPQYYAENTHPAIIDIDTYNKVQERLRVMRDMNEGAIVLEPYTLTGKIHCSLCGKNYKRKVSKTEVAWNCSTYLEKGKSACHTKQIPEKVILDFIDKINGEVTDIYVPEFNKLVFHLSDGSKIAREWQDKSRRDSWTDDMRDKARKQQLEYFERSKIYADSKSSNGYSSFDWEACVKTCGAYRKQKGCSIR